MGAHGIQTFRYRPLVRCSMDRTGPIASALRPSSNDVIDRATVAWSSAWKT